MKVTDLRRKLMAALAAGGVLAPGAAYAADLNTNLVTNAGFENVDFGTLGAYDAPLILDWSGTQGFAYSHDFSGGVPDYANGGPLAGGGSFYFTSNNATPDINDPGEFYQDIDVSTGASGTLIATGTAAFRMAGDFSGYFTNGDLGNVHLEFRNSVSAPLGTAILTNLDPSTWNHYSSGGLIPVGTATVRVSIFGTAFSGGPDGYMDNVDFQVTDEVIQLALELTIDRATGGVTLSNRTGGSENMSGYQITSAFGALAPASWLSIADNYDNLNPGPKQFDAAHAWNELTDPATNGDLSEADLDLGPGGGTGASLAHKGAINLGNGGTWIQTPTEDVEFQYVSGGQVVQGIVTFTGNGDEPLAVGDLNADGDINSLDWVILRTNQHTNLSGQSLAEAYRLGDLNEDRFNNHTDFVAFKTLFDAANGAGAFVAMLAAVPEPSAIFLVATAGVFLIPTLRRKTSRQ